MLLPRLALATGVLCASIAAAAPTSVGVDFSPLPEETFDRVDGVGLEQALVVRLVQEGFAVVALGAQPELVVRLGAVPPSLRLDVSAGAVTRSAEVLFEGVDLPELKLETAQRAVELVRAVRDARPPPVVVVPPTEPPPVTPAPAPPLAWTVLAGVSGAYRVPELDGAVDLTGEVRIPALFAVRLDARLLRANAALLNVLEGFALLGFGGLWSFGPVALAVALEAGAHAHVFSVPSDTTTSGSGTRWDVAVAAPVELVLGDTSGGPQARLRLSPFATSVERTHKVGDDVAWTRGAVGLSFGLHVGWGG